MLGLPWACCWQLSLGVQGMSDGNYFTLPQRSSGAGVEVAGKEKWLSDCVTRLKSLQARCVCIFCWSEGGSGRKKSWNSLCQTEGVCVSLCGALAPGLLWWLHVLLWLQGRVSVCHCQLSSAELCSSLPGSSVQSAGAGGTGRAPKIVVWALVTQALECEQMC